jgi:hypothetical protein
VKSEKVVMMAKIPNPKTFPRDSETDDAGRGESTPGSNLGRVRDMQAIVKVIRGGRRSTQYDKVFASLVCQKISFGFVDDRYTHVSKLSLGSESDGSDQCPRTQQ